MAQNSKIEWTHHTGNLWWGCTKVHEGCDNCYAETVSKMYGHKVWGPGSVRKATKSVWNDFLKWQALAADAGEVHRVFVGSMMDIFEKPETVVNWKGEPTIDYYKKGNVLTTDLRNRFFREIVPACPNLDFLLLTKRPSNINKYIPDEWKAVPPHNVMHGATAVNQSTFDNVIYHLKKVKGRKFLSIEPQLDWIQLTNYQSLGIDWIIQGGESGTQKRPFSIMWAYHLRLRCKELGIPYFFKQIDKVTPIPEDMLIREFPKRPKLQPA